MVGAGWKERARVMSTDLSRLINEIKLPKGQQASTHSLRKQAFMTGARFPERARKGKVPRERGTTNPGLDARFPVTRPAPSKLPATDYRLHPPDIAPRHPFLIKFSS